MPVIIAWLRLDLRRHWRSLAVLALLVAIASGTVLAALAGARRGSSALERMSARTLPATAAVLPNQPGFDWDKIRALPEVESLSTFLVESAFTIDGVSDEDVAGFIAGDDAILRTIERPVVYSGRMFDPSRTDEVVVTRGFVTHAHKGVGDTVVLRLPTVQQLVAARGGHPPAGTLGGPRIVARIVGVVGSVWFSDDPGSKGQLVPSPAVVAAYPQNTVGPANRVDLQNVGYANALVRLRGGESALPQLREDLARVSGKSDIDVWNLPDMWRQSQRHATFEARCLIAFAGAAFVAALFLVGQAIIRYAAASTTELQTLRALGMTPRQAIGTASAGPAIVGLLGGLVGVGCAVLASRWFPIGLASRVEPAPGTSADWVVFGPGLAAVVLLVAGGAAAAAWLALGAARRAATARRSSVAAATARGGLPVPVVIGTRFALESGRGRTSVPVRPALLGAVIGVLGILAAFTFSQGVSDAAAHAERFGQTSQLTAFVGLNGQDFGPADKLTAALTENHDVSGVADARIAVATGPDGNGSVTLYTYQDAAKPLPVVVTSGRMPRAADEVLLAPRSISDLHTRVGDRVVLRGSKGPGTFTVTGGGLVPQGSHNGYADGGWVTDQGYDSIFTGFKFHLALVALRAEARGADAAETLTGAIGKSDPDLQGVSFEPPAPLAEVLIIREVRVLPILLGLFLALLAMGAVGHALATAVRRRSHDLAVLRALGMTRRQCRWVVITQATVLAVVGLIFGVPLGLALGRSIWRAVADYTPLQYAPPFALWALVLVAPAALLLSNLLAAWPGHRAARLRIANVLRSE